MSGASFPSSLSKSLLTSTTAACGWLLTEELDNLRVPLLSLQLGPTLTLLDWWATRVPLVFLDAAPRHKGGLSVNHRPLGSEGAMPGHPCPLELISVVLVDRLFVVACAVVPLWAGTRRVTGVC